MKRRSFVFDSIWMTAHTLETFALLPQLYMISKGSGKVETYTAHFVALMCAGSTRKQNSGSPRLSRRKIITPLLEITCIYCH